MDGMNGIFERDAWRGREIRRVTMVGLRINVLLTIFKIAAGIIGNSRAVVADGIHSLSDLVSDVVVVVAVRFWVAPPDEQHQYGHKRLESLIALSIGVLLGAVGVGIVVDAVERMGNQGNEPIGGVLALSAALSSVMVKEVLYRWTLRKGVELKSDAVEAKAWDHRSDAISSIPIVVAVAVAMWFPSLAVVDLLGAILVAVFILYAAWKICVSSTKVLIDAGAGPETHERLTEYCRRIDGVKGVHDMRTRYLGQGLHVDMHVSVEAALTVGEGNIIAHKVEDSLYTDEATEYIGTEIVSALVHIDPWRTDQREAVR